LGAHLPHDLALRVSADQTIFILLFNLPAALPITQRYYKNISLGKDVMANVSITMAVPAAGKSPALTGSGESVGSGSGKTVGASTAGGGSGRIQQLTKQIQELQQQLRDLANSGGSPEEIKKQQELIQAQIKALQAEIARIRQQEMEQTQQNQLDKVGKTGDGVNRPTDENQIDVYI
jgi:TolA-binding protein